MKTDLRINAANLCCFSNAGDGEHIGGQAHVAGILVGFVGNRGKSTIHDDFELLRNLFNDPEEALNILHPLEIADSYATGVGKNIRDDDDALLVQNFICLWSSGAVGGFGDDTGLDAIRVGGCNDTFCSGWNKDIAGDFEDILYADILSMWKVHHAPLFLLVA